MLSAILCILVFLVPAGIWVYISSKIQIKDVFKLIILCLVIVTSIIVFILIVPDENDKTANIRNWCKENKYTYVNHRMVQYGRRDFRKIRGNEYFVEVKEEGTEIILYEGNWLTGFLDSRLHR